MTTICHELPMAVDQDGHRTDCRGEYAPRMLWSPYRPGVATIGTDQWSFTVTVDGLAAGLDSEWSEPHGGASFRPRVQGPVRWLLIDLHGSWEGTTVTVYAERISRFLAEVLAVAIREDRPEDLREWQRDWPTRPLRNGDAL